MYWQLVILLCALNVHSNFPRDPFGLDSLCLVLTKHFERTA